MDGSNIIISDEKEANKLVANCLIFAVFFIIFLLIANELSVFVLPPAEIRVSSIIMMVFCVIPALLVYVFKVDAKWVKHILMVCATGATTVLYIAVSYHAVMMFVFPTFLSLFYFSKKMVLKTAFTTTVFMILAHFAGYYFNFVTNDPISDTLNEMLIFGMMPRVVQHICLCFVAYVISSKTSQMMKKFANYSTNIMRNNDGLDKVISETQVLFTSRSIVELTGLIIAAVYEVISCLQKDVEVPSGVVAIRDEDGNFYSLNEGSVVNAVEIIDNNVTAKSNNVTIYLPEYKNESDEDVLITEDGIFMSFYDHNMLIGYVILEISLNKTDELLKEVLNILYNNIFLAINNTKLNRDMFKSQQEVIMAFAEISESKSRQTGKHIKRVAEYMKVMGHNCGYNDKRCEELSIAAMMHDVGKLLISPEILEKPGKLTPEEMEIMKMHTTFGESLLKNSPGEVMQMARKIALQHHEKWDGTGYFGIKGEDIDFDSRIMAVADVFDALVSRRSYKDEWPPSEAYDEIIRQSGKHFDPYVVKIFKESYSEIIHILLNYPDDLQPSNDFPSVPEVKLNV
ncbi:MAG: HD domain-containing phosphohydrolase [Oscillospiraceae bacterium]